MGDYMMLKKKFITLYFNLGIGLMCKCFVIGCLCLTWS